ncbi:MAG: Holliday junction branch migration protein RuvA [Solobacterium sp.]|nr:Holliday junction branch migration protein RuvA [Solobacterium sp.]MBQ6532299.1 Holliday junction branch migration protein RuvA [Solobacterium sp.]MBR0214420.1 Holliday junction branch migration protein RuvA [Solobacterium sp.]
MIAFIRGTVAAYGADWVIVENSGMGWRISYPHTDTVRLNQNISVYTFMHVSENDVGLYGFESQEEEEFFLRLISVKGLGPRTAMNMLSRTNYRNLIASIEQGNVATLKSIPGIGAKTASQIILDLKGKLVQTAPEDQKYTPAVAEACDALKNLGYKQGEINLAAKVMSEQAGLKTEEYLKIGLQALMKAKMGG